MCSSTVPPLDSRCLAHNGPTAAAVVLAAASLAFAVAVAVVFPASSSPSPPPVVAAAAVPAVGGRALSVNNARERGD